MCEHSSSKTRVWSPSGPSRATVSRGGGSARVVWSGPPVHPRSGGTHAHHPLLPVHLLAVDVPRVVAKLEWRSPLPRHRDSCYIDRWYQRIMLSQQDSKEISENYTKKKKQALEIVFAVLKTCWKHHKSKDHKFLHRSYTPKKFSTPTIFFRARSKYFSKFFGHGF